MASGVILGKMLGSNSDPQTATNTAAIAANTAAIAANTARLDNRDQKDSVRAASLSNITLVGPQTIDGVAVVAGNRVGVLGQTLGQNNGIYVAAAGAWTRATDADTSAKVTSEMYFFVEEGTVSAGKAYELTTPNPITLGTTVLTFAHFAGGLKTSEIVNDSAAFGTTGPVATALQDAINELTSLQWGYGQLSFSRPNANANTWATGGNGGIAATGSGTATARSQADTSYQTRRPRIGLVSSTAVPAHAGVDFYAGSPAGWFSRNTGFQLWTGGGPSVLSTNMRWFLGAYSALWSSTDLSTLLTMIGIGSVTAAQTNLQLFTNDASGAPTTIDTGLAGARTAGACFDLWLGCTPGASTVFVRVRRLDVPAIFTTTLTSDLPAAGTFLFPLHAAQNASDGVLVALESFGYESIIPF